MVAESGYEVHNWTQIKAHDQLRLCSFSNTLIIFKSQEHSTGSFKLSPFTTAELDTARVVFSLCKQTDLARQHRSHNTHTCSFNTSSVCSLRSSSASFSNRMSWFCAMTLLACNNGARVKEEG